jgi:hypothetical protein
MWKETPPQVEQGLSHEAPLDASSHPMQDLYESGLQQFVGSGLRGAQDRIGRPLAGGYYWNRVV